MVQRKFASFHVVEMAIHTYLTKFRGIQNPTLISVLLKLGIPM